jgi:hypothetical protein
VDVLADKQAVQAALAVEEAKRRAALERQAAEAGDTHWILNFKEDANTSSSLAKSTFQIVEAGFASIDNCSPGKTLITYEEDSLSESPAAIGRRSYGKFNRALDVCISYDILPLKH